MNPGTESTGLGITPLKQIPDYSTGLTGFRVLAIDDCKHIRKFLSAILEPVGVDILCVPSGPDALKVCENYSFDLILIDIRMPEMDGYETLERIRTNAVSAPAIALSSDDSDHIADHHADFCDFLPKPIEREKLIDKIQQFVTPSR